MNNYRNYGLWINGQEVPALGGAIFAVENPTNKQIIARVAEGRAEDVDRAVAAAQSAFPTWTQTSATERFHLLCRLAQLIRENTEELARWETLATGRPIVKCMPRSNVSAIFMNILLRLPAPLRVR